MKPEPMEVLRVGAEPVAVWTAAEESGLPRAHIMAPGWLFRFDNGGYVRLGGGSYLAFTITRYRDESLVPSDEPPDIENDVAWIAGYTLAEMRDIRAAVGPGWVSFRAWWWWFWRGLRNPPKISVPPEERDE